ncbi:Agamous-like MADS-box protein AGL30 [Bienertia sinuspersici]
MEDSLEKSLSQIQREKENFQNRRHLSLENELKDGTQLPFLASDGQQLQSLLWTPGNNFQHVLTQEPKSHSQREIESCTDSTSGSYFGCLSTSSKSEANSPGQLSGIDNIGQDALQGLQFGGLYSYLPYGLNMQGNNSNFQALLGMDQLQSTLAYDAGRNYQPNLPCQDLSNYFLPDVPAAAFTDYSNYQNEDRPPWDIIRTITLA